MATTTPNYGWAVPTSTDLVKDGATAIETLGDSIDASMFTALGTKKAGMVLLNTTSFSAVSSQSINDVFSSTYDNYRIICDFTGSTGTNNNMRLRVSGADDTTSNYMRQYIYSSSTTIAAARSNSQSTWLLGDHDGSNRTVNIVDLISPNLARVTGGVHFSAMYYNSSSANAWLQNGLGFNAATQFTGFTIYPSSGTITGTVSVYGYNK